MSAPDSGSVDSEDISLPLTKRIPLVGEVWRHLKSQKRYVIVGYARDEATSETLILYRAFEGDNETVWARPIHIFLWRYVVGQPSTFIPRFAPAELHPISK
jgi:hypothetical protein